MKSGSWSAFQAARNIEDVLDERDDDYPRSPCDRCQHWDCCEGCTAPIIDEPPCPE